jgi:hypothetical protein
LSIYRLVSLAAKALFFVLIQRTKNQVSRNASFPHGAFALQITQNLGCKNLPYYVRTNHRTAKYYYALQPHNATIILPDFIRSCSTNSKREVCARKYFLPLKKAGRLDRKRGPGGFACGGEGFLCLGLMVTFGSSQK